MLAGSLYVLRFNVSAKIYSSDLAAELINRVECRIEIDSKVLVGLNSRKVDSNNHSQIINLTTAAPLDDTVISNPTLLIDDQLLKASTSTISTLLVILVVTVLMIVVCCSGFMWFKCRRKRTGSAGSGRGPFASSSASSMSTGSPHSPLSELAAAGKKSPISNDANGNHLRRVFSIRLPFEFFDRKSDRHIDSKKFTVS